MVAGTEATHLTVQLLCKSGIQYVFEMIKYIQSQIYKSNEKIMQYVYQLRNTITIDEKILLQE